MFPTKDLYDSLSIIDPYDYQPCKLDLKKNTPGMTKNTYHTNPYNFIQKIV